MTVVRVRIDAEKASNEFKLAKKEVNKRAHDGLVEAGKQAVLPEVEIRAPHIVRPALTVKATSRRAYITTEGPRQLDRIAGLLNWGGTVKVEIRPKDKQALTIGSGGVIRSRVKKPRVYHGKEFIEKGLLAAMPSVERITEREVMKAFGDLAA